MSKKAVWTKGRPVWITLLVIGLGMILWVVNQGGEQESGTPGLESADTSLIESQTTPQAELVSAQEENEPQDARKGVPGSALAKSVSKGSDTSTPSGSDVLWIEGVVEAAEGTPADERMEVIARGKAFKASRGAGSIGFQLMPMGAIG